MCIYTNNPNQRKKKQQSKYNSFFNHGLYQFHGKYLLFWRNSVVPTI